jgi:hypothetical protein
MNWGLFESFCEMLDSIPTEAVLRAGEARRRMVEEDLEHRRTEGDPYVISILSFCDFLSLAVCGVYVSMAVLPVEHRMFYGKVVQRLVDAGELPLGSTEHFNSSSAPGPCFTHSASREFMVHNGQLAKN